MAQEISHEHGPEREAVGEPHPELEVDHPVVAPGDVAHFRLRGPARGTAVVILTAAGEGFPYPFDRLRPAEHEGAPLR